MTPEPRPRVPVAARRREGTRGAPLSRPRPVPHGAPGASRPPPAAIAGAWGWERARRGEEEEEP